MRVIFSGLVICLVLASQASAGPICGELEQNPETGSKTWHAVKTWFHPMCTYLTQQLPQKTPSVLAEDAKKTAQDVKDWAKENEMIQGLKTALTPVKNWLKDTRDTLKDKTFNEMYEDVKVSVKGLDERVGGWLNGWMTDEREIKQ